MIIVLFLQILFYVSAAKRSSVLSAKPVSCLDKSLRYKTPPSPKMTIQSQVSILSIDSISSSRSELSSDIYLSHEWQDNRCKWNTSGTGSVLSLYERPGQGFTWTHEGLKNLWQPDTQIFNAKTSYRPETNTHVHSNGTVRQRIRFSLVTYCPMNLVLYPMDRQRCDIMFQSSAHNFQEMEYVWKNPSKLTFIQGLEHQDMMTPDLKIIGFKLELNNHTDEFTGQIFTQFIVRLYLERPIGYFIWEFYMPASLIVFISFTSFWLDRTATPARVSLGVTTVLTMTTLFSSANTNLPHTSYPKCLGLFLGGCFFFTFMAMVEFSVTSYLERQKPINKPIKIPRKMSDDNQVDIEQHGGGGNIRQRRQTLAQLWMKQRIKPSKVDLYSRVIFPVSFFLFHLVYWVVCQSISDSIPSGVIILRR